MKTQRFRSASAALVVAIGVGNVSSATAAPLAGGSAYDISVHLSVAGLAEFDIAPFDTVGFSGNAAGWSDSKLSLSADAGNALIQLHTGNLTVAGQWEPGEFMVVGMQARVDNVDVGIVDLGGGSVLALAANLLESTTIIGGTCPVPVVVPRAVTATNANTMASDFVFFNEFESRTLSSEGGTDTQGLTVTTSGSSLLGLPTAPAPNTTLTIPGLGTLVLNETILSGDGTSSLGVSTNAAHLTLNALGLLVGDVVIAHSDASIACQ